MKKNHGNFLKKWYFMLLFLTFQLYAENDFSYNLTINNPSPVQNESVILTFDVAQVTNKGVVRFTFKPLASALYDITFLGIQEQRQEDQHNHFIYQYAIFPKVTGSINVPLEFIVKRANTQALSEVATGSRNVLKTLQTNDTPILLDDIILNVQKLPQDVSLVGNFTLNWILDKHESTPYEQINLTYTLKGKGHQPTIQSLIPTIQNVNVFKEIESFSDKLFHKKIYHYALFSDTNFTLPPVYIKAYDPQKKRIYTLQVPSQKIKIHSIDKASLVDAKDSLPTSTFSWVKIRTYINGILLFLAGFITAKLWPKFFQSKQQTTRNSHLIDMVQEKTSAKTLLMLLLSQNQTFLRPWIDRLEKLLYDDASEDFSTIKKHLLKELRHAS